MFNVAVAGHVCVDLVPELTAGTDIIPGHLLDIGPLEIAPGGCVSNTGRALAQLGASVTISSTIGDDYLGSIVRQQLEKMGLDTLGLSVTPAAATSYSIVVEKPNMNRSFWHHVGANALFDGSAVNIDGCDLLHVGYPPLLSELSANDGAHLVALFSRAREMGVTTSLDMAVVDQESAAGTLNWRDFLCAVMPLTDVFSPSIDDLTSALRLDPESTDPAVLATELVELGAGLVVLSAGSAGLFMEAAGKERLERGGDVLAQLDRDWADTRLWAPAVPVDRVVTTNGAGDAATAGLLSALGAGLGPDSALVHAATVAAARIRGE